MANQSSRALEVIDHLELKLRLFLLGTPICLALIGHVSDVHIACSRQYKEMTSALQRSACLPFATGMWGEKKIGSRILVISVIAGAIGSPRFEHSQRAIE